MHTPISPQFSENTSEEEWEDAINSSLEEIANEESEPEQDSAAEGSDEMDNEEVSQSEESDIDEENTIPPGYLNILSNLTNGDSEECVEYIINNKIDIEHLNLDNEQDKFIYYWLSGLKCFNQTAQANLIKNGLINCINKGIKFTHGEGKTEDKVTHKLKKQKSTDGPLELTGNDAILNSIAKTQGLLKLHLFNSGFYVVIKPFSNDELNTFYNLVDEERNELGRYIGAHYYLIDDVFMKQKFIELFCKYAVVDSNLKNWSKKKTLQKAINLQDYDTIVWGQCALLFKDGVDIDLHCANDDCRAVERVKIDLRKIRINNFELLSEEMINQVISTTPVTLDMVKKYQNSPCFTGEFSLKDGSKLITNTPTLESYNTTGEAVISKIILAINTGDEKDTEIINRHYHLNMYKILAPWVTQANIYDDDDGSLAWITKSKDALVTLMENDHNNANGKLYKQFLNFFFATKVSHYCYSTIKCPVCGKEAPSKLKDFTPFDVHQLFFFLAAHRIQLAQMS